MHPWHEMHAAFTSGSVRTAPDDKLLEYLETCSTASLDNAQLQGLCITRAFTINALLNQSFLRREYLETGILTWLVIGLAILSVVEMAIQIWIALRH